jgi:hypothetical protein
MKANSRGGVRKASALPHLRTPVTAQQIEAVTCFLDSLCVLPADVLLVNVSHGAGTKEDPIRIGLREHPVLVEEFRAALYRNGFVRDFNWPSWHEREGWRYIEDPTLLKSADVKTCIKLLTLAVRCDRFAEGYLGALVRSRRVPAVLARLRELA